jgi:hypothetical protein
MDEMRMLAELGRELHREPPASLARQRNRLLDAARDGDVRAGRVRTRAPLRRPLLLGAGAVLVAGALFAALQTAHPGSPAVRPAADGASGSATASVALAGWSVRTQADGSVEVTLRQLTDATALRRALASAKVPARVWLVPAGAADPKSFAALSAPVVGCPVDYLGMKRILQTTGMPGIAFPPSGARDVVFTVRPSALPGGTVVNVVLYTVDGAEAGYYLSVSKATDNACTPYPGPAAASPGVASPAATGAAPVPSRNEAE